MKLYVQNASTLLTDDQVATMTRACAYQARYHAAPAWDRIPVTVLFHSGKSAPPAGGWVITVFDDSDQPGALGWHTEDGGAIFGKVFARPSLESGSSAFAGVYAVSSVLSHEILETIIDPDVSLWAISGQDSNGGPIAHALEVADPVEDQGYPIRDLATHVTVSNFILPAWTDPEAPRGPYDYLGNLREPFSLSAGGYEVQWTSAGQNQVFGDEMPEWRREQKRTASSRGGRRAGIAAPAHGRHEAPEAPVAAPDPQPAREGALGRLIGWMRP